MRPRFKIKAGLQGSSDFAHVLSRKVQLESAHQEFVNSQLSIDLMAVSNQPKAEPKPDDIVSFWFCGKLLRERYSIVKSAGYNWF